MLLLQKKRYTYRYGFELHFVSSIFFTSTIPSPVSINHHPNVSLVKTEKLPQSICHYFGITRTPSKLPLMKITLQTNQNSSLSRHIFFLIWDDEKKGYNAREGRRVNQVLKKFGKRRKKRPLQRRNNFYQRSELSLSFISKIFSKGNPF